MEKMGKLKKGNGEVEMGTKIKTSIKI